jgi:hypothetical protein
LRPHTIDRYGRTVAMVFVGGIDARLELIKAGVAWAYEHYLPEASPEIQTSYQQAEIEARRQQRGLWQQENPAPIPPWEYRHPQRSLPPSGALLERSSAPRGFQRRYPRTKNFYVLKGLNYVFEEFGLPDFCVQEAEPADTRWLIQRKTHSAKKRAENS